VTGVPAGSPAGERWRLVVAYDGAGFHGFAAQDGLRTVAGELAVALGRVTRSEVALTCAGRTDRGVHATGQVVHVDLPAGTAGLDGDQVRRACNRQLAPEIVVLACDRAPAGFDARRSALARRYRYLIVNGPAPDPLLARMAWFVADPLDLRSMATAADAVVGEHDFRAFCRRVPGRSPEEPITRRVLDARWSVGGGDAGGPLPALAPLPVLPAVGRLLAFEITANAFCHQMVRSLVGTLVEVGRGRRRPADLVSILASAERSRAAQPAPAHGLCLVSVDYGP
jgi:tRNA pseudouridine38-40 synthase